LSHGNNRKSNSLVTGDNPGQEDIIVGGDLTKLLADVDTTAVSDQLSEIT
jgi:hypothetical protein